MKIIIGNHIEHSILKLSNDDRIFSQRVIWFAEDGDLIILPSKPDMQFLQHVTSLTGVDANSLKFFVTSNNKSNEKHFDPQALYEEQFINSIRKEINNVTQVLPMWPSPAIAHFVEKLSLSDKLQGASFFLQNGVELVNNKAYFRVFATAAGAPIADGRVCHSIEEAELAIRNLLSINDAVMIKQAHNGAGAGNELLIRDKSLGVGHVGAVHMHVLSTANDPIKSYLDSRWNWASANGKRPVIIEEFIPDAKTIYAEFFANDEGVYFTGSGRLGYTNQRLVTEIAPLRGISKEVETKLTTYGESLAKFYQSIGYRGYLSADAVIEKDDNIVFTEVNSRVGGSLHVYDSIANKVVKAKEEPERTVVQYHSPLNWTPVAFETFHQFLEDNNLLYDSSKRKGILISLPILLEVGGYVSFCIVYENEQEEKQYYSLLDNQFSTKKLYL
ncbi:hypothetical protein MKY42_17345 [Paenibacillus sp. FSL W7-1088]|uniref:preATP grasp domain-containing protein n=1 Tax=Paenibacillus sp. FSL W7-1088 TaxID=2921695 RepID=UPI0030EC6549